MATSTSERVRKYRERQRQANLREPNWQTLVGRLHVADLWLGQGGSTPDSFTDTIKRIAWKLGFKLLEPLPCKGYGAQSDAEDC